MKTEPNQQQQPKSLDPAVVIKSFSVPFLIWLIAVLGVGIAARQPGVVCATPMAWLLALWVGLRSANYTRAQKKAGRLIEAACAGALLGLLQGVLFAVMVQVIGGIRTDERQKALLLTLLMITVGTIVTALLSLVICASQESRRRTQ